MYKAKYNRYKCRTPVKVVATVTWNPDWFHHKWLLIRGNSD